MNEVTLTLPANDKWTLAMRSTLSAVGATCGLSLEMIDDLKIAVDEAFDLITHQPKPLERVRMTCSILDKELIVALNGIRTKTICTSCIPKDPETAKLVIGTLVTDINLESDSCGIHSIQMSLPTRNGGIA